jgi:hypothetical protein
MVNVKDKEVQNNSSALRKTMYTPTTNFLVILASCRVHMFNCIHCLMCLGLHSYTQLLLQKTGVRDVIR